MFSLSSNVALNVSKYTTATNCCVVRVSELHASAFCNRLTLRRYKVLQAARIFRRCETPSLKRRYLCSLLGKIAKRV